jgi:hypothetical protein
LPSVNPSFADLGRLVPVEISQGYDSPLGVREVGQRVVYDPQGLGREHLSLGQCRPRWRKRPPRAGVALPGGIEALGADRRPLAKRSRRERCHSLLPLCPRLGDVGHDPQDPGTKPRPPFEPVEAAGRPELRLLDDVLSQGLSGDVATGQAEHAGGPCVDHPGKRLVVPARKKSRRRL